MWFQTALFYITCIIRKGIRPPPQFPKQPPILGNFPISENSRPSPHHPPTFNAKFLSDLKFYR